MFTASLYLSSDTEDQDALWCLCHRQTTESFLQALTAGLCVPQPKNCPMSCLSKGDTVVTASIRALQQLDEHDQPCHDSHVACGRQRRRRVVGVGPDVNQRGAHRQHGQWRHVTVEDVAVKRDESATQPAARCLSRAAELHDRPVSVYCEFFRRINQFVHRRTLVEAGNKSCVLTRVGPTPDIPVSIFWGMGGGGQEVFISTSLHMFRLPLTFFTAREAAPLPFSQAAERGWWCVCLETQGQGPEIER